MFVEECHMLKLKVSMSHLFVGIANGLCALLANGLQLSHHHHHHDRQIRKELSNHVCLNKICSKILMSHTGSHQTTKVQLWKMRLNYHTTRTEFPVLFTSFKILVSL